MSDLQAKKLQILIEEYRPLVDEALIISICGDYPLHKPKGFRNAKAVLDSIAQTADCEEATGFNPDGFGFGGDVSENADSSSASQTRSRTPHDHSNSISGTTQSSDPSSSTTLCEGDDLQAMITLFPTTDAKALAYVLKKHKGSASEAIDELLYYQERGEAYTIPKGIDSFFCPEDEKGPGRGKKGKKGKKNNKGSQNGQTVSSKSEKICVEEIMFISDRLHATYEEISELYQNNDQSQASALMEHLEKARELGLEAQDEESLAKAKALAAKYKRVPGQFFPVLIQVANQELPDSAGQLASIIDRFYAKPKIQKLNLNYTLAPLNDPEVFDGTVKGLAASKRAFAQPAAPVWLPVPAVSIPDARTYQEARAVSQDLHEQRREAYSKAFSIARRSKGDPLLRAGVAVYLERARGIQDSVVAANARAADLLVAQTKLPNRIDLHGVTVQDAVRIALSEVRAWWERENGRRRVAAGRTGFGIITGKGLHSQNGVAKLRAPVIKALQDDGWEVAAEAGMCTVVGRLGR